MEWTICEWPAEVYDIEPAQRSAVVLASGGLDSSSLISMLLGLGWDLTLVHFDYGSTHHEAEYRAFLQLVGHFGIEEERIYTVDLSSLKRLVSRGVALLDDRVDIPEGYYTEESMCQTVVPGRNTVMISYGLALAESLGKKFVAIAAHGGDHFIYPDCRIDYLRCMSQTIFLASDEKVKLLAPFAHLKKWEVVSVGNRFNCPFELTWSCYKGNPPKHCGACGTCVERAEAFQKAGVKDPTTYDKDPRPFFENKEDRE